jgi:hypothetical protein
LLRNLYFEPKITSLKWILKDRTEVK